MIECYRKIRFFLFKIFRQRNADDSLQEVDGIHVNESLIHDIDEPSNSVMIPTAQIIREHRLIPIGDISAKKNRSILCDE